MKKKKHDDENEMSEYYRQLAEHKKEVRQDRRDASLDDIMKLDPEKWVVQKISDYQYRVNGMLDIWTTSRKIKQARNNNPRAKYWRYGNLEQTLQQASAYVSNPSAQ